MAENIYDLQTENVRELIKVYSKRSEQLKKAILRIVKSGGDTSYLNREKKRINGILVALRKELKELTAAQIAYAYEQGQEETKKDYRALKIGLFIGSILPTKGKKELVKKYSSHVDWAIDRMQTKLSAFVRKDFTTAAQALKNVNALAYNRLGLIVPSSLEKTNDLAGLAKFFETQLNARDIFRVPYYYRTGSKAGKIFSYVKTESYCKMLARTLTAEADRKAVTDIIEDTFKPYGDLVQFVRRGGESSEHTCDDCDFLLGVYLSLHGKTKGYTTVTEAESEYDIFHPNCIHTLRITDGVLKQYRYLGIKIPTMDTLGDFVDAVLDDGVRPFINEYIVGNINAKTMNFLANQNINISTNKIKLTYGKVKHITRNSKKVIQKLSLEQVKNIDKYISNQNVYFDTVKRNLIYIYNLPNNQIIDNRNWIKIPVNINQNNIVATASIISDVTITKNKRYIKID